MGATMRVERLGGVITLTAVDDDTEPEPRTTTLVFTRTEAVALAEELYHVATCAIDHNDLSRLTQGGDPL